MTESGGRRKTGEKLKIFQEKEENQRINGEFTTNSTRK
jgi:hypothetical protein